MAEADVIVSWFASVPDDAKAAFQRPTQYLQLPAPPNRAYGQAVQDLGWPRPLRGAIQKYLPGTTPLRIALLGFSEGCHGLRNLLNSGDAGYVDAVLAIDGVHTPYVNKKVDPNTMEPWLRFGVRAIDDLALFVDTHSSIVPPGYASTTETADWLWDELTNGAPAGTKPPMPDLSVGPASVHVPAGPATGQDRTVQYPAPPWQAFKRFGGFVVLGCDNLDTGGGQADHIYQAHYVLPLVIEKFLADRWNNMDPHAPGASCYVG